MAGLPQNPSRLSPIEHAGARAAAPQPRAASAWLEEKYITARGGRAGQGRAAARCDLRKDPPSIAPYFLEEVRKYLEREYGSQRIYQGGLRVYTTLDPAHAAGGQPRALRKGLRRLDRRARGFVRPEATRPEGRRVPGRGPPRRVGPADRRGRRRARRGARLRPRAGRRADRRVPRRAWARARSPGRGARTWPRCCRGAPSRPFLIQSLERRGRAQGSPRSRSSRSPKVRGRAPRHRAAHGRRAGHGGRLRLRAQQVQPRHPGLAPGGLGLQADRLRGRASRRRATRPPPSSWTRPSRSPTTRASGRRTTTTARFWGPIPLRRAVEQSRNIPAVKTLQAVGIKTGIEYARKLGPHRRAAALPADRPRRRRGHAAGDGRRPSPPSPTRACA